MPSACSGPVCGATGAWADVAGPRKVACMLHGTAGGMELVEVCKAFQARKRLSFLSTAVDHTVPDNRTIAVLNEDSVVAVVRQAGIVCGGQVISFRITLVGRVHGNILGKEHIA